ncbi:ClC family H(+)/Cl(-) exchange transporter [Paucilactobacillus kaifaensis]|uniref:ClC family H(+)/Cl(-) exchange transporter n=1 Tax=Paucilactobacillus kaifaensis TaxID=2559921 RepID=UPI0010F70DFC|nr:ClC family H(+)/Cl(-) exchange transporter [Paucilactobacillus kaifaensis]
MQIIRGLFIGLAAGLVVSLFRLTIEYGLRFVKFAYETMHQNYWLLIPWVIASVLLALLLGKMVQRYPAVQGSGIPQIEGQLAGSYEESWWPVLWRKFFGGILSIGSGLFLGREGPSIQLGATIGQGFAEIKHDDQVNRRVSIASGAAAGLSAAFNAPIASTLFILEEVYHNFSPLVWISALVSALTANFVSLNFFGLTPVLHITYSQSLPLNQYGHLIILGIVLGLLGRVYQMTLLHLPVWFGKLKGIKPAWYPVIPFVLVVIVGWFWPNTLGGGNGLIVQIAQHNPSIAVFGSLLILRFVFSMVSYGSMLPGGIFLPILTIGAVIGGLYSQMMVSMGWLNANLVSNFIIYAMAGYFAGIGKAPFTAILLITEMVGSLGHLMPLAVVSIVAFTVVDLLGGAPIYESLLNKLIKRTELINSDQVTTLQTTVFMGSRLDGQQVRDFDWPKGCLVTSIHRGERDIVPHGDTVIRGGDTLVVSVAPNQRQVAFTRVVSAAQTASDN